MCNPRIHVIIPVYNAKEFLRAAVNSVLNQPYKNIGIVLINDGSTDGSAELCDEIAAQEESVAVIHQENSGVSVARNSGIEIALSKADDEDYIGFCDADDLWMDNAITEDLFQRELPDICQFSELGGNQNMTRFFRYGTFEDQQQVKPVSLIWKNAHFCSSLYACSMLRRFGVRFPIRTKFIEDMMFQTISRYCAVSCCTLSRILYIYRHNSGSAMHSARNKLTSIQYYLPIIKEWIETEEKINLLAPLTGRQTNIGSTLASIYFLDMATKHYQKWGSRRELERVFAANPYYNLFMNMVEKNVSKRQYKEHLLLKNHHTMFRLKHNLLGFLVALMETAYRIPFVKKLYIYKKYPLTKCPDNQ